MHESRTGESGQGGNAQVPSLRWLAGGACAGLLLAGYGLLERSADDLALPSEAVARVNERVITYRELDRAVARLPAPPSPGEAGAARQWVLQRLVEDELLVQRGVDLGIPESDLTVRDAIVQSLVASITAEADAADPSDDDHQVRERASWLVDSRRAVDLR